MKHYASKRQSVIINGPTPSLQGYVLFQKIQGPDFIVLDQNEKSHMLRIVLSILFFVVLLAPAITIFILLDTYCWDVLQLQ